MVQVCERKHWNYEKPITKLHNNTYYTQYKIQKYYYYIITIKLLRYYYDKYTRYYD